MYPLPLQQPQSYPLLQPQSYPLLNIIYQGALLYNSKRVAACAHGVPLHVAIVVLARYHMRITQSLEGALR